MNTVVTTNYYDDVWMCLDYWNTKEAAPAFEPYCFETPVHFLASPSTFYTGYDWKKDNVYWNNGV